MFQLLLRFYCGSSNSELFVVSRLIGSMPIYLGIYCDADPEQTSLLYPMPAVTTTSYRRSDQLSAGI